MTKDEALKLALEALEFANVNHWWGSSNIEQAVTAIKEALAQPERTGWPAGLLQDDDRKLSKWLASRPDAKHVVDMAQPERTWVGLTDAERDKVLDSVPPNNMGGEYYDKEITAIAIAIEAKLKEKNT